MVAQDPATIFIWVDPTLDCLTNAQLRNRNHWCFIIPGQKHYLGVNCCWSCSVACPAVSFVGKVGTYRLPVCQESLLLGLLLPAKKKGSGHQDRNLRAESSTGRLKLTRQRQIQLVPLSNARAGL